MILGFIFGIIIALIILLINRRVKNVRNIKNNNRELLARNDHQRILTNGWDRDWRSDNRYALSNEQKEKMLLVMQNLKRLTRGHEKETVEEIINYIDKGSFTLSWRRRSYGHAA